MHTKCAPLLLRFVELSQAVVENFVFVTAASDNHLDELRIAIYNIRKYHSRNRTIVIYDINPNKRSVREVSEQ